MDILNKLNSKSSELTSYLLDYLTISDIESMELTSRELDFSEVSIDWDARLLRDFKKLLIAEPELNKTIKELASYCSEPRRRYKLFFKKLVSRQIAEKRIIKTFPSTYRFNLIEKDMIWQDFTLSDFLSPNDYNNFDTQLLLLRNYCKEQSLAEALEVYWGNEKILTELNLIMLHTQLSTHRAQGINSGTKVILQSLLTRITDDMLKLIFAENPNLEILDISRCKLHYLPHTIFNFTALKSLDVSENNLSYISDEIENLHALEVLNLKNNKLCHLNDGIFKLTNLKYLRIGNNERMPFKLASAFGLTDFFATQINCKGNSFANLSSEIANLIRLEVLEIQSVGLTELPPQLALCPALITINFIHNKVSWIPEEIISQPRINLILYGNPIFLQLAQEVYRQRFSPVGFFNQFHTTYIGCNSAIIKLRQAAANTVTFLRQNPGQAITTVGIPLFAMYIEKMRKQSFGSGDTDQESAISFAVQSIYKMLT